MRRAKPVQYEERRMSLGKKIAIIVVAAVVGLGGLSVFLVVYFATSAGDSCNKREAAIAQQETELGNRLTQLRINGQAATSPIHTSANGDCLTSSGGTASASFNAGLHSVTEAQAELFKALDIAASTRATYDYRMGDIGGKATGLAISFEDKGISYTAELTLVEPFYCQDDCTLPTGAILASTGVADKAVSSINLNLTKSVN